MQHCRAISVAYNRAINVLYLACNTVKPCMGYRLYGSNIAGLKECFLHSKNRPGTLPQKQAQANKKEPFLCKLDVQPT